jgi:hypothetical protein
MEKKEKPVLILGSFGKMISNILYKVPTQGLFESAVIKQ